MIVDRHMLVRDGLREILHTQEDLVVVGDAGSSRHGVSVVADTQPNVVLLDTDTPGGDIGETIQSMRCAAPDSKVIVLAQRDQPWLIHELLSSGIRGYLPKSTSGQALVSTIRNACGDEGSVTVTVPCESLTSPGPERNGCGLSGRETGILELVAVAMTNAQIASKLNLSESTVKRHLHHAFRKLDAVSRLDAVNKAAARSLISVPTDVDGVERLCTPSNRVEGG
ncbi:response regulator transcription factor [Flindersiella endophytica]